MNSESENKNKIFTERFIYILIIILLLLLSLFVVFFLVTKNRNSSIAYQTKISELETKVFNLSNQNDPMLVCPKPNPTKCESQSSQTVESAPIECSLFSYSNWSACSSVGKQTRNVTSEAPLGCSGGSPVLSQSCTPPVISCSLFTYTNWSTCSNGTQSRTVVSQSPPGCSGGSPNLVQSCIPPVTACSSFTYSNWSSCSNGSQTRTIISQSPSGCSGGSPTLTQTCSIPTVDFKVNGQDGIITIDSPRNVTFSWNSANVTSCEASGSYNSGAGSAQTLNGSINYYVDEPISITISCVGPGGSVSDSGGVSLAP